MFLNNLSRHAILITRILLAMVNCYLEIR